MLDSDISFIKEVLVSIHKIETYISSIHNKELLLADSRTYDAVLLQFIVIGESCKRISTNLKTTHAQIDWRGANDFRNFVAHDYFGISEDIIWSILQFHLPKMKLDFEKLLAE